MIFNDKVPGSPAGGHGVAQVLRTPTSATLIPRATDFDRKDGRAEFFLGAPDMQFSAKSKSFAFKE